MQGPGGRLAGASGLDDPAFALPCLGATTRVVDQAVKPVALARARFRQAGSGGRAFRDAALCVTRIEAPTPPGQVARISLQRRWPWPPITPTDW